MKKRLLKQEIVIYQARSGAIELSIDAKQETFVLTQQQVAEIFDVQKAAISKHVNNIFNSGELTKKATVSILETVQKEGERKVRRKIEHYNLDLVLSIGYRVNSVKATKFRQWATKTLRQHIVDGYTIDRKRIANNYDKFLNAMEEVRALLPDGHGVDAADMLGLIALFADTWLSLDAYDKKAFTTTGMTKKKVRLTAASLNEAIAALTQALIDKGEATNLFAVERERDNIESIVGNVMQSFDGQDLYAGVEEKAAHLLYFMVKNHPFLDGNKRSGAFSFVWFLNKTRLLDTTRLTPHALTALTLFIAESNPKDKERIVGLILLLLKK